MTSYNSLFNAIALAQGIQIGSPEWIAGGLHGYSGTTGGHPAYGWRHDYLMSPMLARAAVSNSGARGCHYTEEPLRSDGYEMGGRPVGWSPEIPGDLPDGKHVFFVKTPNGLTPYEVSGPDVSHEWASMLWTVIDDHDDALLVSLHDGSQAPAWMVAKMLAEFRMRSLAGMVRNHQQYIGAGRPMMRVLDSFIQASRRGCVDPEDAETIVEWLDKYALPKMEKAPGVGVIVNDGGTGLNRCRLYHELGWMILPLWEAEHATRNVAEGRHLPERLAAIRKTRGQWMLDIEQIAPGGTAHWNSMVVTQTMKAGDNGKPLASLLGAISKADLYHQDDYTLWSVASLDVVRADHPGPEAEALYAAVVKKAVKNAQGDDKVWLVDRNRDWIS